MDRIFIGVDNGLDGGVVFVDHLGKIFLKRPMPTESDGKRRKVDVLALRALIEDTSLGLDASIVVEKPAGSKSVLAAVSMADSFARIETLVILLGCRRTFITAKTWQKEFWVVPKMAKGQSFDTKAAALLAVGRLWPSDTWLASSRCRVAHDGMVDAALIAEYARRKGL